MRLMLVVHILTGALGLASGFVAIYTAKGGRLHRRSGMVFVYAMVAMTVFAMLLAAARGGPWGGVNFRAAALTVYLVLTALTTVRPAAPSWRWLTGGGMLVALAVAVVSLTLAFQAVANGGRMNGVPAFPFFLFGIVGALAVVGDVRVIRSGPLEGAARLARHLWRMSFALLIAAMSFFFGQMKVMPKPMRIPALLAIPVVAILLTMLYWLWRVRIKRSLRGLIGVSMPNVVR